MKQKDFVIILSSIAIFTFFWVVFTLWHIYTTSTIKDPLTTQLLQIPGKFDTEVLESLKNRTMILAPESFEGTGSTPSATIQLSPTPEISPSPVSTESGGSI